MLYADPAPEYGMHRGGRRFNKQPARVVVAGVGEVAREDTIIANPYAGARCESNQGPIVWRRRIAADVV